MKDFEIEDFITAINPGKKVTMRGAEVEVSFHPIHSPIRGKYQLFLDKSLYLEFFYSLDSQEDKSEINNVIKGVEKIIVGEKTARIYAILYRPEETEPDLPEIEDEMIQRLKDMLVNIRPYIKNLV